MNREGSTLNDIATAIGKDKSNIISLIIPGQTDFFASIGKEVNKMAYMHGYEVVISHPNGSTVKGKPRLSILLKVCADRILSSYVSYNQIFRALQ